jgi:hypothetical protein
MAGNEDDDQQNWAEPERVPQCLSSYLRTCTIHNFLGLQSELMLAKYILKNARNLQIMKIMKWKKNCPHAQRPLQHVNFYFIDNMYVVQDKTAQGKV